MIHGSEMRNSVSEILDEIRRLQNGFRTSHALQIVWRTRDRSSEDVDLNFDADRGYYDNE